jgi:hypothetical protein
MTTPSTNPANPAPKRVTEATRIPMSVPRQRLAVPEIPGFHLHWFLSQNVHRAVQAGYSFVEDDEVDVVNSGVADDAASSGSTDMGSRVSRFAGGLVQGTTEPQRLYLMKLPQEWRNADMKKLEETNERIAAALRGGNTPGPNGASAPEATGDRGKKYLKAGQDLFFPKTRKV